MGGEEGFDLFRIDALARGTQDHGVRATLDIEIPALVEAAYVSCPEPAVFREDLRRPPGILVVAGCDIGASRLDFAFARGRMGSVMRSSTHFMAGPADLNTVRDGWEPIKSSAVSVSPRPMALGNRPALRSSSAAAARAGPPMPKNRQKPVVPVLLDVRAGCPRVPDGVLVGRHDTLGVARGTRGMEGDCQAALIASASASVPPIPLAATILGTCRGIRLRMPRIRPSPGPMLSTILLLN